MRNNQIEGGNLLISFMILPSLRQMNSVIHFFVIFEIIRPPDIVCPRTYILPVFLLLSSFFLLFSPPNLRGR